MFAESHPSQRRLTIKLAQPRGFCAGVVRAINIVEQALKLYGSPVYVLHEIVHNQHVVAELRARGAVFIETLDQAPSGAVVVFSAHGVARTTYDQAQTRRLVAIDATCPLVAKVHSEVARHARAGTEVVMIGHRNHPEVVGTLGWYDNHGAGRIHLVETVADVAALSVAQTENLAYVTQTTLSVDDTAVVIDALKQRFANIQGPRKDDICYATQNRQAAVRRLAGEVDLLIVVGARNSSNSNRLREVGAQLGIPAYLVENSDEIDHAWLRNGLRVGISAGASTPEVLVRQVLARLRDYAAVRIDELQAPAENVTFRLPAALAQKQQPLEQSL